MQYLNKQFLVNGMTLQNRLVMPPMATAKSTPNGKVSDALCAYYRERAEGGHIGLIIAEHSYVSLQGKASGIQLSLSEDGDVEGLKLLVRALHIDGTKAMAQLNHAGSAASLEITGLDPVGPSAVVHPRSAGRSTVPPHALSRSEIVQIVYQFADAARRAKQAGFDGVEIHAAHGYLLNQFYSPLTNRRTDAYGADSIENRMRFHLEVLAAVRETVGRDYPVAVRLGGCDYRAGGSTLEDSVRAGLLLAQAGADLLDISGGMFGYMIPGLAAPGYFREMSAAIRASVTAPVLLTGGVTTAQEAEALLGHGDADLIGVGRALLKDARWAEKAFL